MSGDIETSLRAPQAYGLARKAIEAMEAHGVWPTVLNFEIWVHYVGLKASPGIFVRVPYQYVADGGFGAPQIGAAKLLR